MNFLKIILKTAKMKHKNTYTAEEYKKLGKKSKYRNVVVKDELGKKKGDSIGELRRYEELKLLEKAGEIKDLEFQKSFLLQEPFVDNQGKKHRAITYIADFAYKENCITIIEDFKGFETKDFKIKKKLLLYKFKDTKDIKIFINKKT